VCEINFVFQDFVSSENSSKLVTVKYTSKSQENAHLDYYYYINIEARFPSEVSKEK